MALNTEKCNAWVERDKKVFAPTQHLSYYPMVIKRLTRMLFTMKMITSISISFPVHLP